MSEPKSSSLKDSLVDSPGGSPQASLANVNQRIRLAEIAAGRNPSSVKLLAVSKTRPASMIFELFQAGQHAFGENYLQEALEKINALDESSIEWHFIGAIQSNKTRPIAENFAWVQTIASTKIAQRLNKQRPEGMPDLSCCIQVNIDDESNKAGVSVDQLNELAALIDSLPRLCLRGLMCIPRKAASSAASTSFKRMSDLFTQLQLKYPQMDTLSMGMSADLESAIAGGSTMVRIGTDIFGPRD